MPVKKVDKIWMNGKLVNWDDAKIHVLSHVIHYGSSWFEGIRCYETAKGSAIFRLDRHLRRLFDSAKIYRTRDSVHAGAARSRPSLDTIRANKMQACYIRPVVYRGYGDVGVNPLACPVDVAIAVWEWGTYLGHGSAAERDRRLRFHLEPARAEHAAGDGEGRRQLHPLAADEGRSHPGRLQRSDRAGRERAI